MQKKFEKDTSGVLLVCSKKGLKKYFVDNIFSYNYPDGILPLINNGSVIALTTESSEDVKGEVMDISMNDFKGYRLYGEQNFFIEEEDEIYILSHSEFTQICSNHSGDIDAFSFWNEKIMINNLRAGWAIAFTHCKMRSNSIYLRAIIQLIYTKDRFPYPETSSIPTF